MKPQSNKLAFTKKSIVELNDKALQEISGGSLADVINHIYDAAYAVGAATVHIVMSAPVAVANQVKK